MPMLRSLIRSAVPAAALAAASAAHVPPALADTAEAPGMPCQPVAEVEFGDPVICTGTLEPGGQPLIVRLAWDILADTDELHVTAIETAASPEGPALARFDDIDLRAPLGMNANGFEFADMNFDGYTDFRLIEFLPAGPNAAYFNAVYDPASGRHERARVLDMLSAPSFDAESGTVISAWRSNAATHGEDVFAWQGDELMLRKRTVSEYDAAGGCVMTAYEPRGNVTAEDILFSEDPLGLLDNVYESPC